MKQTFSFTQHGTIDMYIHNNSYFERKPFRDDRSIRISGMLTAILDFDLKKLKGKKIVNAVLKLYCTSNDFPKQIELTSISNPWDGASASYYYCSRETPWVGKGWFSDCIMSRGNSQYSLQDTTYNLETRTLEINVPASLIYSIINEQSYGLGIVDYKSKLYSEVAEKKAPAEKLFNVNSEAGPVPVLEVEYNETNYVTPSKAYGFIGAGLESPESFDTARVLLSWMTDAYNSEYRYYRILVAEEKLPLKSMTPLPKYQVPDYNGCCRIARTEVGGLKPDTEYWFALVVGNNGHESPPVYTKVHTLPAIQPLCPTVKPAAEGKPGAVWAADDFQVYVADELSKVNPVTGNVFELNPKGYAKEADESLSRNICSYFDGQHISMVTVPGEKLAFQLIVEQKAEEGQIYGISVNCGNREAGDNSGIVFEFFKTWYIKSGEGWFPEALIPIEGTFAVPFEENNIPAQKIQAIFVDIEVPDKAQDSFFEYELTVEKEDGSVSIPLCIEVKALKLAEPDFAFELNGYVATPVYMGRSYNDPDFFKIEEEYYKAAARHYMTVNILPYSHFGTIQEGFAPEIEIVDGVPKVTDWSEWDAHFEKYLNGSFTEKETGQKTPVTHIYLPIHENWPMAVEEYYRIKVKTDVYPQNINQHVLNTSTIEEDFLPGYREGIKEMLKEFIRHIDEKGWKDVQFQYFFNNKQFYKEKNFIEKHGAQGTSAWLMERTCGNDGKATSWWLLDEPFFRYDWKALAYYGSILREARQELNSGYNVSFRADLSRYNLMYDSLDGILDVAVISGRVFEAREDLMRDREERFGESNWVYGGLNSIDSSNLDTLLWVLDTYLKGGTGLVPWNNYALDDSYEIPTDTAAFYPGNRFGLEKPVLSLRLKSARKGLQLIRYLETLRRKKGMSKLQLKAYVAQIIDIKSKTISRYSEDAGLVRYAGGSMNELEALKREIVNELQQ